MSIDMDLKAVFENMDYGTVQEPENLAREWLSKYKYTFPPDVNSSDEDVNTVSEIHGDLKINICRPKNTETLIENSKNALKLWGDGEERRKLLIGLASELMKHEALICQLEMVVRNILPKDSRNISIPIFADFLRYYAALAFVLQRNNPQKHPCGTFVFDIQDEIPLCVLSFILPAALAAGNVVIIRAQLRLLPLAFLLSELCRNIGFPEGVVAVSTANLEDLLNSDNITNLYLLHSRMYYPKCAFLRSQVSALHVSRGAKMIIFDSADLDSACDAVPDAAWSCKGKLPWSINEVYVQESIFEFFVEKLEQKLKKLNADNKAYSKTQDYVITEVTPPQNNLKFINNFPVSIGYKVFGKSCIKDTEYSSILTVLPFRTVNEVATLVNNNRLGFAASVWTENIGVANDITTKLKVGIVWVNTHGYISPASSFSLYKDSGNSVIGGDLGLNDFISHTTMCMFSPKTMDKEEHFLPSPVANKSIYIYYGGSFKRSDSGLSPESKDVRNCVEIAKKGYESWSSLKPKVRGEHILKLATASEIIKIPNSSAAAYWINFLHNWVHACENLKSLIQDGNPSLRVLVEPVGVIVVDSTGGPDMFTLKLIAGALAIGNAVIVVNHSDEGQLFFTELCKAMSSSGIPVGVFNVFFNPNDIVVNTLCQHREVQKYYTRLNSQRFHVQQSLRIKNIENYSEEKDEIMSLVTKNKSVWTYSGETFV